ncbi:hypothetical protein ADJ77_13030 [Prevotella fusca JCM 17724]|uniref:Uncharacterized protein n=1 Tax=Prevotella fusca JCM 17724 TaxID=1236517 RepID=A0A0K1NNL1_9BACT|nr:hypothetical protein ADJ77_13030 [Prevotella fusca JCM 17724]
MPAADLQSFFSTEHLEVHKRGQLLQWVTLFGNGVNGEFFLKKGSRLSAVCIFSFSPSPS